MIDRYFDTIVIGGGHAGTEAALAAARVGVRTLLLTHSIETLGQMSCNPAIGGIGKGHLVKEIDAMGGVMAHAADQAGIQFRILNASKGAAVRATRAQADRLLYKNAIRNELDHQENLVIFQQEVADLIVKNNKIQGIITTLGLSFFAPTVILSTGTFLSGKIHIGSIQYAAGRAGDPPANRLAERLKDLPFRRGRLKTGTPCRIDGRSIDYSELEIQWGDTPTPIFSFMGSREQHPRQIPCHITYTNEKTHDIIANNLSQSAMYSGQIEGVGPRYCPSIEDKIVKFRERSWHQIFIEPEGLSTYEIYPNGLSTSLPFEIQALFIHSIKGFEKAHITRPGYAIEYDFFDPRDLKPNLETQFIEGLFFAGQINGTTGYEEAAAQGLMAGLNAARQIKGLEPWAPRRDQAYIGVLIDDLITRGTTEPYRMFTSRAEYRLLLREDNADQRLTPIAQDLGLISEIRWKRFCEKRESIKKINLNLQSKWIHPKTEKAERVSTILNGSLSKEVRLMDLLRRPEVNYTDLQKIFPEDLPDCEETVAEQIQIETKYAGYIIRQQEQINQQLGHENTCIPKNFDYTIIKGFSTEVKQRLMQAKPTTLGMASRLPGITPAATSILLIYLKKMYSGR